MVILLVDFCVGLHFPLVLVNCGLVAAVDRILVNGLFDCLFARLGFGCLAFSLFGFTYCLNALWVDLLTVLILGCW